LPGLFFIVSLLFFPLSCGQKEEIRLIPPAAPPLSREEIGFGVVNVSYTHVAQKPDSQSLSLGYLRRGSVVRILERRIPSGPAAGSRAASFEAWVLVEGRGAAGFDSQGWLPEQTLDIYAAEAQALTAAETLLQ
jgi:hypothetical protein